MKAAVMSGQGDLLSDPRSSTSRKNIFGDTIMEKSNDVGFGTFAAEITSKTSGFFSDDDGFDLDRPTEGFSSISEAINDIRCGKAS